MQTIYEQIVSIPPDGDVHDLPKDSPARELFKKTYSLFEDNKQTIEVLRYIAYAYDRNSDIVELFPNDRERAKVEALRKSGMKADTKKSNEIVNNENKYFNQIVNEYLDLTETLSGRTLITLEEVLNQLLAMLRENTTFESLKEIKYFDYVKAIENKAQAALTSLEVLEKIKEQRFTLSKEDKNIHNIGYEEIKDRTPEEMLRRRSKLTNGTAKNK